MCKTIKQKVKFQAPPLEVYELITVAKVHRAFTGKPASNQKVVGGKFSSYNGFITGINVDLVPGKRVVQAWRERSFPDGIFSMATFNFLKTQDGGTELTLVHRGVPKHLIPRIEEEWKLHYWNKMKRYLTDKKRS